MSFTIFFIIVSVITWLFIAAVLYMTTPKTHKK
jgi:hypothetical protein